MRPQDLYDRLTAGYEYDPMYGALCNERDQLKAENAKLREERDHWHVEQVHAYGNWEDARKRAIELAFENAKLRSLIDRFIEYVSQDRCEGCVFKSRCNDALLDECWQLTEIRKDAAGLGIEVQ